MGQFADFFIARDQQVSLYPDQWQPPAREVLQASELTEVDLVDLWMAADPARAGQNLAGEFSVVVSRRGGEQATVRLPTEFVALVAKLTDADRQRVGEAIVAAGQLGGNADAEGVAELLKDLQPLAAEALASKRGLYLWSAL